MCTDGRQTIPYIYYSAREEMHSEWRYYIRRWCTVINPQSISHVQPVLSSTRVQDTKKTFCNNCAYIFVSHVTTALNSVRYLLRRFRCKLALFAHTFPNRLLAEENVLRGLLKSGGKTSGRDISDDGGRNCPVALLR